MTYLPTVIELYHMIRVQSRKFFAQKGNFQEKEWGWGKNGEKGEGKT